MNKWQRWVSLLFYAAFLIFLILYLRGLDFSKMVSLQLEPVYLLLAFPIALLVRFMLSMGWMLLIRQYGEPVNSYFELNYVYAKAWLGKYIPGKVAWIAGKVYFAAEHGINKKILTVTAVVEAGIQMLTALGVAFLFLLLSGRFSEIDSNLLIFSAICFVVILFFFIPPIFTYFISTALLIFRRERLSEEQKLGVVPFFKISGLYTLTHAMGSVPFFCLIETVYPELVLSSFFYLGAISLLSGVLGTLAIFAPSGLGVREGVQLLLLAPVLPKEVVVVAVLFSRIWSVTLDLLFYAISLALSYSKRHFAITTL